ncbi:Phosphoacetylglucosamine mutase-like protein [Malassezia sympodialis ATCC 42132]|uniref:Phosphoacetylglucosamine mutase-like protein n=1 Tax=Malassezia sympodialis (strain ATCC 42132) TaxID=1230383 RepID=UPI0002C290D2|nr:Phosphoacetylglucosamine mutase-like protein [Malassezia sympodialis ATCC 42132]CCU98342.1 Phosphoacetylglucosamine mutase-like protein [Malassezia sympodialis ATCC 42132]|eukprot:XP_018739654.1 Phosphoacetylglucosamine mutase-like protein [Malassezia sympodialis ATCC 42132]
MYLPEHKIADASKAFPKPSQPLVYGTAGFRTKCVVHSNHRADLLTSTCFRMGMVAALRSLSLDGAAVGLMVTASHNPEPDNGIKMVDSMGQMLAPEWEPLCTAVANAETVEDLIRELRRIVDLFPLDATNKPHVVYAWDSRPSSPALVDAIRAGLHALDATSTGGGLLTTPQLHYLVLATNTRLTPRPFGEPSEQGYYRKLANAYMAVAGGRRAPPLVVDCANGVGARALQGLLDALPPNTLDITALRTALGERGQLNHGCGADFVKSQQRLPEGYADESAIQPGTLLCSFDGDADRIVFYYLTGPASDPASFHLLDGDKIASLAADYLSDLVKTTGVPLQLGCVQTAYANGASTAYLQAKVPITCTKTGVKHLHHAAEQYDVGVYFEANGHGTVLFSPHATVQLELALKGADGAKAAALHELLSLAVMVNQTVGDALSDMLLVLVILAARAWDAHAWDACYSDLPNRLAKVTVRDRTVFRTTDAERRLTSPAPLQAKMDELVHAVPSGRAFVRPSGTEDCVRVYAEAATTADAERLVRQVSELVSSSA